MDVADGDVLGFQADRIAIRAWQAVGAGIPGFIEVPGVVQAFQRELGQKRVDLFVAEDLIEGIQIRRCEFPQQKPLHLECWRIHHPPPSVPAFYRSIVPRDASGFKEGGRRVPRFGVTRRRRCGKIKARPEGRDQSERARCPHEPKRAG